MDGINLLPLFVSNLKGLNRKEKYRHLKWMAESIDFNSVDYCDLPAIADNYFLIDRKKKNECVCETAAAAEKCDKLGIKIISLFDSSYPLLLKEIYDPPVLLYIKGSISASDCFYLSVVGTRHATGKAMRASFETAFYLSMNGINVVSGLAAGIDAEAHKGCLLSGGRTTAVLGSGVDLIYPLCNRRIAEDIISGGGTILSEYPPGTLPLKYHFPERNRIISGLSSGTILIEAPAKSGALITADYALEHNRDIFIHAAGLASGNGAGGKMLSDDGAEVFHNPASICEFYGFNAEKSDFRMQSSYFDSPVFVEEEINNLVVNYKGVLYRSKIYA